MSTNAHIVVRVRKEDLGTKKKFSSEITPTIDWIVTNGYYKLPNGKEKSKEVELTRSYIGVHHHWDSDTIGGLLSRFHNTYEKALNLVLGGHISYTEGDKICHYANRKGERWQDIMPRQTNEIEDFNHHIVYLFDYDHWKVKGLRTPYNKFFKL